MDFLTLAKTRYSVREYLDRDVDEEKVLSILEAGRVAPTAANRQPVRVVVAEGEALNKISASANIYGAPLAFVVCELESQAWVRPADGKVTDDIDSSIVCDHMMMEATSLGLGTVWICWFDPDAVHRDLGLPEGWRPVSILAAGYARGDAKSPERFATERLGLKDFCLRVR